MTATCLVQVSLMIVVLSSSFLKYYVPICMKFRCVGICICLYIDDYIDSYLFQSSNNLIKNQPAQLLLSMMLQSHDYRSLLSSSSFSSSFLAACFLYCSLLLMYYYVSFALYDNYFVMLSILSFIISILNM